MRNATTTLILKPEDNGQGYLRVGLYKNGIRSKQLIHKLVAREWIENPSNKKFVDHINHIKGDNCVSNLRYASATENGRNRLKQHTPSSSVYKGVYLNRQAKKWQSYINISGARTHLGLFEIEREAAEAYNTTAAEHFGEFAKLNNLTD